MGELSTTRAYPTPNGPKKGRKREHKARMIATIRFGHGGSQFSAGQGNRTLSKKEDMASRHRELHEFCVCNEVICARRVR